MDIQDRRQIPDRRSPDERFAAIEADLEHLEASVGSLIDRLNEMHEAWMRYKGFLGGIAFVFTGIGAALVWFQSYIAEHWK